MMIRALLAGFLLAAGAVPALANDDAEVLSTLYRVQAAAQVCQYEITDAKKAQLAAAVTQYEGKSGLDAATMGALKAASAVGVPVDPSACKKDTAYTDNFKATITALDALPK